MHQYALEKEAADEAKREAKRLKNAEKRAAKDEAAAAAAAAAGGSLHIPALDGVRFTGTFGATFAPEKTMTKKELRVARMQGSLMEVEDEEPMTEQAARKKAGFEVARRNYLIKKARKLEKQKERRAVKSGKKQVLKIRKKST